MWLSLVLACAPEPLPFCQGETVYDYAPDPEGSFTAFPDDHWTVADSQSTTGLRVSMLPKDNPVLASFPENYQNWLVGLSTLDGFGLSAGMYMSFRGELPSLSELDLRLYALTEQGVVQVPAQLSATDFDRTLIVRPQGSLPPSTRVAAVLVNPASGECVAPGGYLRQLLDPEGEQLPDPELGPRFRETLELLDIPAQDVGAMLLFTTQSAHERSIEVAQDIAERGAELGPITCELRSWGRACESSLEAWDYRVDGVVPPEPAQPRSSYTLPVSLWLPPGPGPHPVILCGHGLGGGREQCDTIQPHAADAGFALVAIDAVEHGEHPAKSEPSLALLEPLMIFAIQLSPPGLDPLVLRDNFRQSAWDKLQLIQALLTGVDVDGDGQVDLDPERIGYAGVSLGAIMGAELMALSPDIAGAWMAVGGGRITQIIQDGAEFAPLVEVMAPEGYAQGDLDRTFVMLQTMVDPGDPAAWASYVQRQRLLDGAVPDIYLGAVLDDRIVPNSTSAVLAQAFGAPGVGEQHFQVPGIPFEPGSVQGNGPQGATLGFVQYDQVQRGGTWQPAQHSYLHDSDQGIEAILGFFEPLLFDGSHAVVVDPGE